MYELGMSPAVAAVLDGGPSGSVEAPLLAPGEGYGLGRPIAEGFAPPADGSHVEVRAWGEGTGPLIYTATLTAKNGRSVTGMGYTPVAAEEDAMQAWMRGEG